MFYAAAGCSEDSVAAYSASMEIVAVCFVGAALLLSFI
jgi:hypothetical protein